MRIVDKKPIPMYESKCGECGTVFMYKKSEVHFTGYIECPVCGIGVWANTLVPVDWLYDDGEVKSDE